MTYLVEVDWEDGENHNYYFDTLEEAKKFALKQKGHRCDIYVYIGYKNEYNESLNIEQENK